MPFAASGAGAPVALFGRPRASFQQTLADRFQGGAGAAPGWCRSSTTQPRKGITVAAARYPRNDRGGVIDMSVSRFSVGHALCVALGIFSVVFGASSNHASSDRLPQGTSDQ